MPIVELTLSSGRWIMSNSVLIEATYSGLVVGRPTVKINDLIVASVASRVEGVFPMGEPVLVIDPPRTRDKEAGDSRSIVDLEKLPPSVRRSRTYEWIPRYRVAASFESSPISDSMDASSLVVAWFQDSPYPVPSGPAVAELVGVDWEVNARDFCL